MAAQSRNSTGRLHGATSRILITACVISSLVLLVPRTASAQHQAAPFIDSGTVTFVTNQASSDLDPASLNVAGSDVVARSVSEPLVALDGSSLTRFKPVLAAAWKTNADQSVWTVYLRHGVTFHTGRCCMTATDVKYNFARTMLAGLANTFGFSRFMTNPMKQIKIVDPYTVEFDLGRPQPLFIDQLSSLYISLILDSHALKAHATKSDPWGHLWATDHDAGTGPYTIQSWQHGQQVTLVRFPDYWGGWSGRHFSKAIMRTVPETATRRELLERGRADITFELTPQDDVALSHNPAVKLDIHYGTEVVYIAMTEAGPLASPLARQALSYAFPYDAFINGYYRGFARRAYGCLASSMLGFDPNIFKYPTDLTKARALLQKAGVKPGTTLTFASYSAFAPNGLFLQAQLAQLGINLKVENLDEAAFTTIYFGNDPPSKRPNLMGFAWWPDFNDPYDECNILYNSADQGAAGANTGFYHNTAVDATLNQMKTADPEDLIRLSKKMQDLTSRVDPPSIWTVEPAKVTILAKSLQGFIFNPVELDTYDFYSMYRS